MQRAAPPAGDRAGRRPPGLPLSGWAEISHHVLGASRLQGHSIWNAFDRRSHLGKARRAPSRPDQRKGALGLGGLLGTPPTVPSSGDHSLRAADTCIGHLFSSLAPLRLLGLTATALAGADDYVFEPVTAQVKRGDDAVVAARLVHRWQRVDPSGTHHPQAHRHGSRRHGQYDIPLAPLPKLGARRLRIQDELDHGVPLALNIAAKVPGEQQAVIGKITFRATN